MNKIKQVKNSKLIMTLLVRDEVDIIRDNIEFHLAHGVDFIIATDNGSLDGTREILKEYEDKGLLFLIDELEHNYDQANWVNRMGRIALDKYKADIIFHCDADEFWYPKSGNLKNEIFNNKEIDVLSVDVINVLLEDKQGQESFPKDTKWAVTKPIETINYEEDSKLDNFYLFKYPPKVIFKTKKILPEVVIGNHSLKEEFSYLKKEISKDINIFHFPLRNKNYFLKRVKSSGEALVNNKWLKKGESFHMKRWYESYKNGKIDEEYKKLVVKNDRVTGLKSKGIITNFDFYELINRKNKMWKYNNPKFEYEDSFQDFAWPWAGHKYFAYDLISNTKPKKVVELGTHYGTSLWSFSQAVKDFYLDTEIYAVDTWKGEKHSGFYGEEVFEKVNDIKNKYYFNLKINLIRKTFDEAVKNFDDNSIDILHIDGLHTYEAVKSDFEMWLPKITENGIIIFHDIVVNRDDFGVYKLWKELKEKYKTLEFRHSYGLGVLFKGDNNSMIESKEELELHYSYLLEDIENNKISNILDESNKKDEIIKEKEIENLNKNNELNKLNEIIKQKDEEINQKNIQLDAILNSNSWKITKPIRLIINKIKRLIELIKKALFIFKDYGFFYLIKKIFNFIFKKLWKVIPESFKKIIKKILFFKINSNKKFKNKDIIFNIENKTAIVNQFIKKRVFLDKTKSDIDIIVCVHNAIDDFKKCIDSIIINTNADFNLIIVDDGSDNNIDEYIKTIKLNNLVKIRNKKAKGYTFAANQGLKISKSSFVVLLNSDTIVTKNWINKMINCANSDPKIGMVGPLSNTASWQSIPEIENDGDWANNEIPISHNIDQYGYLVEKDSVVLYPRLNFLNGFCLLIKRELINNIGYLDENNFGKGYGEENDYCIRAIKNGWELAVADDTFIFHAQSKSYSNEKRVELCRIANEKLISKHGESIIEIGVEKCKENKILKSIRARASHFIEKDNIIKEGFNKYKNKKVLFVLPICDAGGGGNVVIQESIAMLEMGVDVAIFNLSEYEISFRKSYPDLRINLYFGTKKDLLSLVKEYDVIVATIYYSIDWIKDFQGIIKAYYIQDFEPYFFEKDTNEFKLAINSYSISKLANIINITKTIWNYNELIKQTNTNSNIIGISANTDLFRVIKNDFNDNINNSINIVAMIRVCSKYRNPYLTANILYRIKRKYGNKVNIIIFGSNNVEIDSLNKNFNSIDYYNCGILSREKILTLFSNSDIFIDLSVYQAMGLTSLESMNCGVATCVPLLGGSTEFAKDNYNSMVLDTSNEDECFKKICLLIDNKKLRDTIRNNSIIDGIKYYPEKVAFNILKTFFGS